MTKLFAPFRVIGRAIVDWWDAWLTLVWVVIVWFLAQITIVLGPPATFGLYYVAESLVNGESLGLRGLIDGARKYFLASWLWALLNLFALLTVWMNLRFYAQLQAAWAMYVQILFLLLGGFWLSMQFYLLPFFFTLKEPKILLALRNAFFITLASPLYTMFLMLVVVLIALLSAGLILPIFFGIPGIIPILGFRALFDRLEAFGIREREKTPRELEREQSSRIGYPRSKPVTDGEGQVEQKRES